MRRWSLRTRAAAGAVAVVGLALIAGSVALVALARDSLTDNVREAAELRAEDVALALAGGAATPADLAVEDQEDSFIQVVDGRGHVVASSTNVAGLGPAADLGDETAVVLEHGPVGTERFVVAAVDARRGDDEVTVLAGRALDATDEITGALVTVLVVGVPLLLALVGVVAWQLVGRALAPVHAMTAAAEDITATDLDRRLPAPAVDDEIGALARTLNAMLGRLADARDRSAAFVADAAHELRSPVASLRQHAEVALAHPTTVDTGTLATTVRSESLRLQRLTDDLLLLARGDQADPHTPRRAVDLDDVVARVVGHLPSPPGIRLDTSAVSGGQVVGDEAALDRLVGNLVENALRHARGEVRLVLVEGGGAEVTFTVEDDGAGIAPGERDRVFDRFVRLDDARSRDAGGAGLGLAIVAVVAAAHGATVTLDDSELGGARFRVRFGDVGHRASADRGHRPTGPHSA